MSDDDVEIVERVKAFQGYFRIDRYRLRHRRFEGGWTEIMQREVFERGHAVGVLLYDPYRDQVVLIEQFRIGAYAAGRPSWLIEIVAGVVEPGEAPEDVARREALEEAGCTVGRLERICDVLLSPGAVMETVAIYCGQVDASAAGGVHGVAHEHEDIKVHVMSAADAIRLFDDGHLSNAVVMIALGWFARHHGALRERWRG